MLVVSVLRFVLLALFMGAGSSQQSSFARYERSLREQKLFLLSVIMVQSVVRRRLSSKRAERRRRVESLRKERKRAKTETRAAKRMQRARKRIAVCLQTRHRSSTAMRDVAALRCVRDEQRAAKLREQQKRSSTTIQARCKDAKMCC